MKDLTVSDKINLAIETADLLFVDGKLMRPFSLEGERLGCTDIATGIEVFCNINDFKIESYEEGYE